MSSASLLALGVAALAAVANAVSLTDVCTTSYATSALPDVNGLTIDDSSVTVSVGYNYSVTGSENQPDATFDYCQVSFTYAHNYKNDSVSLTFWLPAPDDFQNRYLSTGGGGAAINSGTGGLAMGVPYGAVAGFTDGGFGTTDDFYEASNAFLYGNYSINYEELYMFSYSGHFELATVGKAFTSLFFNLTDSDKLYSYYQGCSEGGREGMSQVQKYEGIFDGAITGAPAFRQAFQQVNHLYSGLVEYDLDYYPPPCMFEKVINETIAFCDPLDGKTDGVIARSDLCILEMDYSSLVGEYYSCAESQSMGPPGSTTTTIPAVNGTITKKDIKLINKLYNGLHNSAGKRAYFYFQPGAALDDAETSYDSSTGTYYNDPSGIGAEWVRQNLELLKLTSIESYDGITYDTLVAWMNQGYRFYMDVLNTAWPDLTPYQSGGGKIIHYHGEQDFSVPTASSVHYYESVRKIMYPDLNITNGAAALNEWYKLYLIPGAGHCGINSAQDNGPWPQNLLEVMINWVENGDEPDRLNATILDGDYAGTEQPICAWPNRPLWVDNGTTMDCVFDKKSYETWVYNLNAIPMPVY